ncbi:putative retrotransposon hot spot protein (RHS) [Trypanosoma cruzi]|uniref:Putative retrotransposon hot spot protein (RHS) n=1 Tax=Trypanosoma cruzi TaxID=5693 RepID=A0A2V2V0L3_TRYCR|nr:putative retrotransposon hot spot protein (RHS) [Trypanosoma cruzi]
MLGLVARLALLRGGGPRLPHRQALQCGCMAHRPPSRASATPNAVGTAGRNSRECPFGASGACWPQLGGATGMLHRTGVVVAPRRGSCDGSDAAARRVAGSKVWPRWTMSSTVEEILQEENTSSTNMRLSDFLWNYVGGRAAVDERLQCDDGGVCSGAG